MPPDNLFGDSLSNSFIVYNFKVEVKIFSGFGLKICFYFNIKKLSNGFPIESSKLQKKDAGDGT